MVDGVFPAPFLPALDDSGVTLSGAKLKFYLSGTSTPAAVYSSPSLATSLGSTVTADSAGRFVAIWLDPDTAYRCDITTSADVLIRSIDPVNVAESAVSVSGDEQAFTGDGNTLAFTLVNVDVSSPSYLIIHIDGAYQPISGAYTVSTNRTDTTVTFTSAPPNGSLIKIRYLRAEGARGAAGVPAALTFTYSTTTTDSDPGAGTFRLNSATIASVTAAYIDDLEFWGASVATLLSSFDDSSSTVKGTLTFRGVDTEEAFAAFSVTGSVVDGPGYKKFTLTHLSSGGTWTNGEEFAIGFSRTGDVGATGAGGATYAATFGDGAATTFAISHSLGTRDLSVHVYDAATYAQVFCNVTRTDVNTVTLDTSPTVPTSAQYRVVVQRTA